MGYADTLDAIQIHNVEVIVKEGIKHGFSMESIAAMLAIASKECELRPRTEKGYSKTDNARIKSIFSAFKGLTDQEINDIKKDDIKFFNKIYGGRYGNAPDEGHKFRGRFFNQLTFKGNYAEMSKKIGIDLVTDPDKYNSDVLVAAKVMFAYFKSRMATIPGDLRKMYSTPDVKTTLVKYYHANAGWKKTAAAIAADPTGGLRKAKDRVGDLLLLAEKYK